MVHKCVIINERMRQSALQERRAAKSLEVQYVTVAPFIDSQCSEIDALVIIAICREILLTGDDHDDATA